MKDSLGVVGDEMEEREERCGESGAVEGGRVGGVAVLKVRALDDEDGDVDVDVGG